MFYVAHPSLTNLFERARSLLETLGDLLRASYVVPEEFGVIADSECSVWNAFERTEEEVCTPKVGVDGFLMNEYFTASLRLSCFNWSR